MLEAKVMNEQTRSGSTLMRDMNILLAARWELDPTNQLNWRPERPISQWQGVIISDGKVIRLNLQHRKLTGIISPELVGLTNLKQLSLSGNELTGRIPPEVWKLQKLEQLYLSGNKLTGNIPPELGRMINLRDLTLANNRLTGVIPPEFGKLTNLQWLLLSNNFLYGWIPGILGQLLQLECLDLSNNKLQGPMPASLANLSNLRILNLSNNTLSGDFYNAYKNWQKLERLELSGNDITGTLPHELALLVKKGQLMTDVRKKEPMLIPQIFFSCAAEDIGDNTVYPPEMLYWHQDGWYCEECLGQFALDRPDGLAEDQEWGEAERNAVWKKIREGGTLQAYLIKNPDKLNDALVNSSW